MNSNAKKYKARMLFVNLMYYLKCTKQLSNKIDVLSYSLHTATKYAYAAENMSKHFAFDILLMNFFGINSCYLFHFILYKLEIIYI